MKTLFPSLADVSAFSTYIISPLSIYARCELGFPLKMSRVHIKNMLDRAYFLARWLTTLNSFYTSLENIPKWSELKTKWPASIERPIPASGRELVEKAEFLEALYE